MDEAETEVRDEDEEQERNTVVTAMGFLLLNTRRWK
jgi:hypothetical protein